MVRRCVTMAAFCSAVVTAGMVFTAGPAQAADGWQRTNDVADSSFNNGHSKRCVSVSGKSTGCFQPYGDWVWLRDLSANNVPVGIDWEYEGSSGERSGLIYNDHGTTAGMTNLNKNFTEGGNFYFRVCEVDLSSGEIDLETCSSIAIVTT
ncbi:hypothetical protein ACPZ19_12005 [Amycolatopsis lurida]